MWGPRRLCCWLNSYNRWLLLCGRCNHDVKLIVNGCETCVLVLYIGNYATKKQSRSSNTSALLAKRLAFHRQSSSSVQDILDNNRLLLQRCTNALITQKEFSGPEIASYLMGWGDTFISHSYSLLFLDAAMASLYEAFPGLQTSSSFVFFFDVSWLIILIGMFSKQMGIVV